MSVDERHQRGDWRSSSAPQKWAADFKDGGFARRSSRFSRSSAFIRAGSSVVNLWPRGIVLRCASCDSVQIGFMRSPARAWFDVGGIDMLEFPLSTEA